MLEQREEVETEVRIWKRKGDEGLKCRKMKREYKEFCEKKERKKNDTWEKQVEVKRESEIQEIVNQDKKRRKMEEGIEEEEWKKYFIRVLEQSVGR